MSLVGPEKAYYKKSLEEGEREGGGESGGETTPAAQSTRSDLLFKKRWTNHY